MTSKVQSTTCFILFLAIFCLFGCQKEKKNPLKTPPSPVKDAEGFGATYEITLSQGPDLPDEPPHLSGDTLVAQVAYSGGCTEHSFLLGSKATPDTTRLWLHHRTKKAERCSTRIHDRVRLPVPDSVLGRPHTLLMMPQDTVPFRLYMTR